MVEFGELHYERILPAKRLTIQANYRAGYSKLEIISRDRKIVVWGARLDRRAMAVIRKTIGRIHDRSEVNI